MVEVPSGRVVLNVEDLLADRADSDFFLDSEVLRGGVAFAPSITGFTLTNPDTSTTSIRLTTQRCPIIDGVLYPPGTRKQTVMPQPGVLLAATTQPDGSPSEFHWTAFISLARKRNVQHLNPVHFQLPALGVVDLVTVLPTEPSNGVVYVVQDGSGFATHAEFIHALDGVILRRVTQAEYDAIPTPRPSTTLYIITP